MAAEAEGGHGQDEVGSRISYHDGELLTATTHGGMPGGVYFKQPQHISTGMLLFDAFHGSQGPEFCTLHPLLVHQEFFFLVGCLPWVPGS